MKTQSDHTSAPAEAHAPGAADGRSRPRPPETPSGAAAGDASGTAPAATPAEPSRPREIGGQAGPEPTRYGDWEKKGRCTDF